MQVRDVHGTQRSKFTNMISIHLHHSVPNIIKICIFVKVMMKKSVAPFHVDTVCNLIYCTPTSESCVCHVCCTSLVRVLHESRASVARVLYECCMSLVRVLYESFTSVA